MKPAQALVELNRLVLDSGRPPGEMLPKLSEDARKALAAMLAEKYDTDVEAGLKALCDLFPPSDEWQRR